MQKLYTMENYKKKYLSRPEISMATYILTRNIFLIPTFKFKQCETADSMSYKNNHKEMHKAQC